MPGAPPGLVGAAAAGAARKGSEMGQRVITLSDADFDEQVRSSDQPVLVDFWAEWCGPCKMIAPILEELADQESSRLRVAKLNIDENREVPRRFEVLSIPTLILFKDGQPQHRIVGARGKSQLLKELEDHL